MLCLEFSFTQNYLWPTDASRTITTVFGDVRPRRYHAGIDIRTYGINGKEVYAIESGYIERIRTSSTGYGKTVYIRLKDGKQAVYAHLSDFSPSLKTTIKSLHNYYNTYKLDHYFEKSSYPVRRGELIGYTGDTGTISGPHLHFEIRDENGNPINPLSSNLKVIDTRPPIARSIAIMPLSENTLINGFNTPKIFQLEKSDQYHYQIKDTININGIFGVSLDIIDHIDLQPFNYGIYAIEMSMDDEILYSVEYDKFSFEEQHKIFFERDYTLNRLYGKNFTRLYTSNIMDSPAFVEGGSLSQLELAEGYHQLEIEAKDYNNNFIIIRGVISSFPLPEMAITLKTLESGWNLLIINSNKELNEELFLTTLFPDEKEILKNLIADQLSGSRYRFKNNDDFFPVIKITTTDDKGVQSPPKYISSFKDDLLEIPGNLEILHYEHGVVIQYNELKFSGADAEIILETSNNTKIYPMQRISKCIYSSPAFHPNILSDINHISMKFNTNPEIINKIPISGITVSPENDFKLINTHLNMGISGDINTFFDTTFVWMEPQSKHNPKNGTIINQPVFIGPRLIPFRNPMKIEFRVSKEQIRDSSLAIYYFNEKNDDWIFMNTETDFENNILSTTALSGELFSVISEHISPKITTVIPDVGGSYTQSSLKSLSFYIKDDFSGIRDENNISVLLDNAPIIFEYNSYRKQVIYEFDSSLNLGSHLLSIEIVDNVGNKKSIKGSFEIVP